MGLPIGRLIVATNENDVLHEFFTTGTYRVRDAAHTYVTSSPSMDISKASNFERYIYDIVGRNAGRVRELWTQLALTGEFTLNEGEMRAVRESGFASAKSTHAQRLATIGELWREKGIMIDPHTADAVKCARDMRRPGVKMMVLETALPAKFSDTIREATGLEPPVPASYADIAGRAQRVTVMDPDAEAVKQFIRSAVKGE